jgi:acyl transferase domain-containing protein
MSRQAYGHTEPEFPDLPAEDIVYERPLSSIERERDTYKSACKALEADLDRARNDAVQHRIERDEARAIVRRFESACERIRATCAAPNMCDKATPTKCLDSRCQLSDAYNLAAQRRTTND